MRQRIAMVMLGLGLAAGALPGQSPPAKEAGRTILLELFTSEGCAACPEADAMLARLNGTKTEAGDLIIGISEHVTYMDRRSWRDPFSTEAATERHSAYGEAFSLREIFVPQLVINGETQLVTNDESAVRHALEKVHPPATILRIESAKTKGRKLDISFTLMGPLPAQTVDVYAVIAEDAASSNVKRGENANRTLTHVAVATSLVKVATIGPTAERKVRLPLPAVPPGANSKRHLVLFAQMLGLGTVLATDTVPL